MPDDKSPNIPKLILKATGSLKITVVLLSLGMFLVFVGTLAQTRFGTWDVIHDYFRSLYVFVPVRLITEIFQGKENEQLRGPYLLFPGGFTILGLLSLNMFSAMVQKIMRDCKSSARKILLRRHMGIYILHVGMIVMFAGEFVTGLYAKEGTITIPVGGWSDYVEDHMDTELVFLDTSDPEQDHHVVIPEALLRRHAAADGDGEVISHPDLPFDIRVEDYMLNAEFSRREGATAFQGMRSVVVADEIPRWPGTEPRLDTPAIKLILLDKESGERLGGWLCVAMNDQILLNPQASGLIAAPQRTRPNMPLIQLRFARRYLNYRVYLDEMDNEVYDGTNIPHNYSSDVRMIDKETGAVRNSHVWMNHPLRYEDATLYQHQMPPGAGLTGLMVVNNVGVWMPYISCAIVTLGMLVQFSVSLFGYGRRAMA